MYWHNINNKTYISILNASIVKVIQIKELSNNSYAQIEQEVHVGEIESEDLLGAILHNPDYIVEMKKKIEVLVHESLVMPCVYAVSLTNYWLDTGKYSIIQNINANEMEKLIGNLAC